MLRLSADFGNGSMDLTDLLEGSSSSLWSNTSDLGQLPTASSTPYATQRAESTTLIRNFQEDPNKQQKRHQQHQQHQQQQPQQPGQAPRQASFRKPLSLSYSQATNNPKKIGVINRETPFVDINLKQWISHFNNLSVNLQHSQITKYEENGQSCKIMNKPFHYNENDRAFRASMFSQNDMEYERSKLVLAKGKEWHELKPQEQQSIYEQVNNMAQQNRNILVRCITIEQYYRNQLQNDIYAILDKYLSDIKDFNHLSKNKSIKEEIMREIRELLMEFQTKYMQYTFKYIIKLELMERKDQRLNTKHAKLDKKRMRKHKNMGGFITTSNCFWDTRNDDFIAIQWPKHMYYKPVRPVPKTMNQSRNSISKNEINHENNSKNVSENVSKNANNSVETSANSEDANEIDNTNESDNESGGDMKSDSEGGGGDNVVDDDDEYDPEKRELELRLKLREKLRITVSEEEKQWETGFLKPVYCLLSVWALKTYDYFNANLPNYSKNGVNERGTVAGGLGVGVGNKGKPPKGGKNKTVNPMSLGVSNKDLKDENQKEKHARTVSFATENKIEEGDSEEESDTPDNMGRNRSKTVEIGTDDEYDNDDDDQ